MTVRDRFIEVLPSWFRGLLRHLRDGALLSTDAHASFSQEGEDLLLARLFEGQDRGFYVDVGAHHPTRFSNTHLLYLQGWRGINLDATPGTMAAFQKMRPRDINLEVAVASDGQPRRLYIFNDSALNSVSEALSAERDLESPYVLTDTIEVSTRPLRDILAEQLPRDLASIDLMNIDVEGYDVDVLESNDWDRFRPRVVLVEALHTALEDLQDREEIVLLRDHGYRAYAKLVNTVVLIDGLVPDKTISHRLR